MQSIKEHMKQSLENQVVEAFGSDIVRPVQFRACFNGFEDEDGLPITVDILVPAAYKQQFSKFVQDEAGNIFTNAEDWKGNPIGLGDL
jgi:hypothetical protein